MLMTLVSAEMVGKSIINSFFFKISHRCRDLESNTPIRFGNSRYRLSSIEYSEFETSRFETLRLNLMNSGFKILRQSQG